MDELPRDIVISDVESYAWDWSALSLIGRRRGLATTMPSLVVKPRSNEETSLAVRWACEREIPVVARGGGSGVCGAALPSEGSMVLDMTAMNRVIDIDEESLKIHVECGIAGPDLERALNNRGMTLGHVPQSFHLSTVGGWISTKATGQLSTRYGGIEERVLGLTAVLSDGVIVSSRASPRSAAGPDWWRLFLGAEGLLGVVTEATLCVSPIPEQTVWMGFSVPTFPAGLDFMRLLMRAGMRPSVARLYDAADVALNFGSLGLSGPAALLRFEGKHGPAEAEASVARELARGLELGELGPGPGEHWWEHRFAAAETYRKLLAGEGVLGPHAVVDTMEVAAFWSGLPRLYESVAAALEPHADGVLAHASHLYTAGANIYFTFFAAAADEEQAERRYRAAWEAGMRATLDTGGTISHHHGVGVLKAPWMQEELGSGFQVLRRLKDALDPKGILNPGKWI